LNFLSNDKSALKSGDTVIKTSGYRFAGVVVAAFCKRDGTSMRYVVENDDGLLHIFNAGQLQLVTPLRIVEIDFPV
jgi:hypothetical protein